MFKSSLFLAQQEIKIQAILDYIDKIDIQGPIQTLKIIIPHIHYYKKKDIAPLQEQIVEMIQTITSQSMLKDQVRNLIIDIQKGEFEEEQMHDIIQCINSFKWLINIKLLFLENILTLQGSKKIYNTLYDWEKLYTNYE